MPSLNKCFVMGHLGKDAEAVTTPSGYPIVRFSVAADTRVKKNGEWTDETEWFRVTCLGERYQKIADRLTKGALVFVEGRLQTRSWEGKDGQKRYQTELIADDLKLLGGGAGPASRGGQSPRSDRRDAEPSPSVFPDDDTDSAPF